jgi:hypothetical protein
MSKDEAKPTTVEGWIKYYQARGEALEGVSIDPVTGERTMLPDLVPDPDEEMDPLERAWLDDYKRKHPEVAAFLL